MSQHKDILVIFNSDIKMENHILHCCEQQFKMAGEDTRVTLSNKNRRIAGPPKQNWGSPFPRTIRFQRELIFV